MPSIVEPQAPAPSKLSTTVATGGDPSARGVQQAAQTPKCFIDARTDDDSDTCKGQGIQGTPTREIVDADDEDQRDAIISILEDWAAWERNLEEGADVSETKKADEQAVVTGVSGISAASLVDTQNDARTSRVSKPNDDPASAAHSASGPSSKRGLRATFEAGNPNQLLLYASRRERRRAEIHDPIARARRQALKVWAADQTRRRSSAEESTLSERLKQQGRGSFSYERATVSVRSSRRSSTDATVDRNRKGGGGPLKNEWFRRRKPPYRASAPREISAQRHVRNIAEIPPGPQRSTPTVPAAGLSPQEAGRKSSPRYPWRANMKEPEKRPRRSAFDLLREGDVSMAPSTPRVPTTVLSSPSSSSSLVVAGRGSAWARSPSRETAGGILVKHCFFYGSSDKATPRRAAAEAATASTSFESQWMRQFREEVQRNPNWWLSSDRFVHGRACASPAAGNVPGGAKGASGRSARPPFPTALTHRGGGGMASQTTDLWNEVRLLLAAGRQNEDRHTGGSRRGPGHDHEKGDLKAARLDILSFGDRLRYTPLSQGAWLVGEGATATSAATTSSASAEKSARNAMLSEEVHVALATRDMVDVAAAGTDVEERQDSKAGRSDALSRVPSQSAADEIVSPIGNVRAEAGHDDRSRAVRGTSGCHDLQSIHAATLAKLRGEIDPFTREELVLRAAEEARGALARDRARNTSPRRASAGVFRPSPKARKRDSTPDAIDYDTVEATLSLIELATRAAGPDAGKQMLQALEDLDKIHQRVSDEKGPTENERWILDGKADGETLLGAESGLNAKVGDAGGSDATRPRAPGDSTAKKEGVPVGGENSRTNKASGGLSGGDQGAHAGGAVRAETEVNVLNSNGHNPGRKPDAGDVQSNTDGESLLAGTKESATLAATSPEPGRKFSLASSDAEDANGDDTKGQEDGRAEFPSSFEGSDTDASDLLGKIPGEKVDSSDNHDETTPSEPMASCGGASVRQGGEATVIVTVPEPATELSGESASRRDSREPPPERSVGVVNDRQGDETEMPNGVQHEAEEDDEVEGSGVDEREARDGQSQTPARRRARRSSEGDKPTGLPHLAAEMARVEESVSARENYEGDPASSVPQVSPVPISNGEFKAGTTSNKAAVADEEINAGGASHGTVGEGRPGERHGSEGEKACGNSPPTRVAQPKTPTPPQTISQTTPAEDPWRDEPQTTEPRAEGEGSKDGLLQHRGSTTVSGSAQVESGGGRGEAPGASGNSPSSVLMHRDSWVSVGTRPRRGRNNAAPGQSPPCVEGRTDAPPTTKVSAGRVGFATQATTKEVGAGSDAIANKKDTNSGRAPGIVRRSPLIDALHPEVARQREFQGKRRHARQRDAAVPASEKTIHPADVEAGTTASAIAAAGPGASTTGAERRAAGARASPIGAPNAAARAATGNAKSTKKPRDATTAAVVAGNSTDTAGASRSRRRRPRSLWAETAHEPAAPLPVSSFRTPPSPAGETSRLTLVPAASGAAFSEGASIPRNVDSPTDDASRAGRLTPKQSERVEEWLARAERSLGPKVWTCLGSGRAFRRTCGRIIRSIIVRGGGTGHTEDRRDLTENRERPPGGSVKPAPGGPGRSRMMAREGRKEAPHKQARKGRAIDRDREEENDGGREGGGARVDDRSWDEDLSERTALVTEAVIWTIATERERKTACAAIAEARNDNENGNDARERWDEEGKRTDRHPTAWGKGGGSPGRHTMDIVHDSSAATSAATTELRISLSTARRFIKRSRLTDGVHVIDADVDLAFKRWEEVERLAGLDQQCSPTAAVACGEEDKSGRVVSREVGSGLADAVAVPIPQKVCEAVGCSDPARYGDIGPKAKARLCRKHRHNGMVDVGSRRCDRPDCGRLAVGAHTTAKATSLCTLHARSDRVDVEGMAFVLLMLSKARHTRRRGKAAKTASAAVGGENQAQSARNEELAAAANLAALNASAVRNVLLAMTEQPLAPCSPTVGRELLPAAVRQSSEAFGPGTNTGGLVAPDELLNRRIATPTDSVSKRALPRSAAVASGLDARRKSQHQRGSRGANSSSSGAGGSGEQREEKDVVEPVSRGRKQSHAPTSEEGTGGGGDPCGRKRSGEGPRSSGHHATGASDEVAAGDGHQDETELPLDYRAAQRPDLGSAGSPGGSGIDHRGGDEDQHQVEWVQQSRGSAGHGEMPGELAQTLDVAVDFGGRGGGGRRSGVHEVLEKNAPSLHAMYSKFARQSTGCERGTVTTMTLCDVIRFCDSFELRPGLVSTREILDAYKTIAFPGVLGLSDEDIGYSNVGGVSNASDTKKPRKGRKDRRLSASCRASASPEDATRQRKPSSASTFGHADQAGIPASGDSKGVKERVTAEDTETLDAELQSGSAPTEEGKLRALTLQDLATGRPDATSREAEHVAARRGSDKAANAAQEGRGTRGAGRRRSTIYGERSNRGAGSRRGTTQQDDDECSLYFRSDSGAEGYRMPSPSRRTSTSSSGGGGGGGGGGRGKRTVYLGRTQAFPLRRVESNLAVDARGFGLSGVCPERAMAGDGSQQQARVQKPPTSSLDGFTERTSDMKEEGGNIFSGSAGGADGEPSVPEASGLTEAQFFQWVKFVAVECKALVTKKAFGNSLTRPRSKSGRGTCRGKAESVDAMPANEKENGSRRQGIASAVVLLQWMEVSRGMRAGKGEGIPPFKLSSCLANTMPLPSGE
ncbi:hypothetical protein Esi_0020_0141 [Ectocarpus siliculosus]|uniref:Uncharacterized protein n=1 Tax=Ectocarpus siliculosus TaxID=2880 RepID=D8LHY9_ECTSI|nr:hypothetical protein Esi_0020_0141 [Ectocarpus siliculosus]|eukprot:CBN74420.1 hypothetical protein Esi_0020_0141 [Ectocarpus siliculosus]